MASDAKGFEALGPDKPVRKFDNRLLFVCVELTITLYLDNLFLLDLYTLATYKITSAWISNCKQFILMTTL